MTDTNKCSFKPRDANLRPEQTRPSRSNKPTFHNQPQLVEGILRSIEDHNGRICKSIFGVGLRKARKLDLSSLLKKLSAAVVTGGKEKYATEAASALCRAAGWIPPRLAAWKSSLSTLHVLAKTLLDALQNDSQAISMLGGIEQVLIACAQQGIVPQEEVALGLARFALKSKNSEAANKCLALLHKCGIEGALPMVPMSEQLLQHKDAKIRRQMCSILAWLEADAEQAFGLLLKTAGYDPDSATSLAASKALRKIDPAGTRLAKEVSDAVVRRRILAHLRQAGVAGRPLRRSLEREWAAPSTSKPSKPTPAEPAMPPSTNPSTPPSASPSTPPKPTTPITQPKPFNPSSDPWLVVAPRNELITWLGEPIPFSSFKEHQLDYFLALAHHAGEPLTCDDIAKFAKGAASDPASLGPILCRIRRLLRPAVQEHSAELIGASPEAIKWEFIVCSPGREYKKRPRRYTLAIDLSRVRFED